MTRILLIIAIGLAVAGCPQKDKKGGVYIADACETAWRIFYRPDGRFAFSDAEIDALSAANVSKIYNFKRWFKAECPEQYALTKSGKK